MPGTIAECCGEFLDEDSAHTPDECGEPQGKWGRFF